MAFYALPVGDSTYEEDRDILYRRTSGHDAGRPYTYNRSGPPPETTAADYPDMRFMICRR